MRILLILIGQKVMVVHSFVKKTLSFHRNSSQKRSTESQEKAILDRSTIVDTQVVATAGTRQIGESTLLHEQTELQERKYITLDDFAQLAAAKENPDRFVGNKCLAVYAKSASSREKEDLVGLKPFLAATPHSLDGILAYNGNGAVRLAEKLWQSGFPCSFPKENSLDSGIIFELRS